MNMATFKIEFKGYRLDKDVGTLTNASSIYVVYRCLYGANSDTVDIKELLYIGQATRLRDRLQNNQKRNEFLQRCNDDETICYSYAVVDRTILDAVENGLIFMQQPYMNELQKDRYNYNVPVSFELSGKCGKFKMTSFNIIAKP